MRPQTVLTEVCVHDPPERASECPRRGAKRTVRACADNQTTHADGLPHAHPDAPEYAARGIPSTCVLPALPRRGVRKHLDREREGRVWLQVGEQPPALRLPPAKGPRYQRRRATRSDCKRRRWPVAADDEDATRKAA
eukprot:5834290-Pleurochrysis_carterae.AAC.2